MYVKIEDQKSKQQMQQTLENEKNSQMHGFGETGAGVPAFLAKLWRLVDDPETNNLICWSKDGRSFIIQNQAQFARELLPLNYKHNNMASFIRQLNMYGFHKITSIENGGLKFDRDEMEFSHPYFKRNCSYLLEHIKRKISNTKHTDDKSAVKTEAVTKVLQDVRAMRGRQDSLDSRFSVMKQENEALWREIASLRQKHAKQQQIVNKLIQFLITIVQPSRNMSGVKRHMQLMINDTPEANFRKTSESESECGPVIHELGEELLEEVAEVANDDDIMDPISPYARSSVTHPDAECPSPLNMERPKSSSSVSSQHYDYSNQSIEDAFGGSGVFGILTNQNNISPNITSSGGSVPSSNNNPVNNNNGSSVVQSVTPDGVQIVYHVTEVPDTHPNEQDGANRAATPKGTGTLNEENVLTTPMVREQMARTQMLKQKNKQRRQQNDLAAVAAYNKAVAASRVSRNATQKQQPQQQQPLLKIEPVKVERDIDPMLFLNTCDDNHRMTPDPHLISPNYSEDSAQSSKANVTLAGRISGGAQTFSPLPGSNGYSMQPGANMYNAGDFINDNIPNELFDDSSILSTGAGDNSSFSENFKLNDGKFSAHSIGGAINNNKTNSNQNNDDVVNGASTSTQALKNAITAAMPSTGAYAGGGTYVGNGGKNGNRDMTIAKYNKNADEGGGGGGSVEGHTEIMRDEVDGHLENVQDELETLRELLRGDGYSLDANTLMNLFNDSEVLGPYGLSVCGDLPNNQNRNAAKGSELMTYQPSYDLSDILDKSELEEANSQGNSLLQLIDPNSSGLNTPYHE